MKKLKYLSLINALIFKCCIASDYKISNEQDFNRPRIAPQRNYSQNLDKQPNEKLIENAIR